MTTERTTIGQAVPIWPARMVFLVQALVFSAWLPRIPDIKSQLDLSAGELGLALAGLPAGSLAGFVFAAWFARRVGLRRASMISGSFFALSFIPVGWAGSVWSLALPLAVCGFGIALTEVAMSSSAGQIEKSSGRRIMSQCHGFWSIGSVAGALLGGAISQAGMSITTQFLVLNPLLAIAAILVARGLRLDPPDSGARAAGLFVIPRGALWLLCLLPVGVMALEGAVMDWSAIFVRDVLAGEPIEAAAAYATFSTLMAVMRLSGDRMANRFGARNVLRVASVMAIVGLALFASAQGLPMALVGAAFMGAGVAPVFPLTVSAAAAMSDGAPESNVAAASFVAFLVFLVTPPLVGGLTDLFGLRAAFFFLVPGLMLTVLLTGVVRLLRANGDRN